MVCLEYYVMSGFAISAISKLAGLADSNLAVSTVLPLLQDPKPQVRQYAIRALSSCRAIGTATADTVLAIQY